MRYIYITLYYSLLVYRRNQGDNQAFDSEGSRGMFDRQDVPWLLLGRLNKFQSRRKSCGGIRKKRRKITV